MQQPTEGIGDATENDRRDFLKKAGIGAAAAWTAPMVISQAAHAQGTGPVAIQFVDSSTASNTGASLTVSAPPGIAAGDQLLAVVATNFGTATPLGQDPAGTWTQLNTTGTNSTTGNATNQANNVRTFLLARVAAVGDSTFTFTRTGGANTFRAAILAFRNVASVGPNTAANSGVATGGGTTSHTFPSVTTDGADQWVVRLGALAETSTAWSLPGAPDDVRFNSGATNRPILAFSRVQAAAGASGTVGLTSTVNSRAGMHSVVLRPS
jgi:hypothetical protein